MNQSTFKKVLIANRGEIALRIMRTAEAKGFYTIAVYSDADIDTPHTRFADEAWHIGGAAPKDSYLNIDSIINVAKKSGAQAIHPGYGFLAENAGFAKACKDAGIVFIGPSAAAIAAMGDKAKAKQLMRAAGVPCIDGYDGSEQTINALGPIAELIGFPLMIKASAGGGGRGMRLVQSVADFPTLLASAQSEALNSFGDATVLLEKAVINPRHIEIQVVADRFGKVIHLGERDCSIQRRHQKIIEEAPSPAVTEVLRHEMGQIAIKAAQAIQYEGVGTFEFLLDENGKFYFMEMNTRLQVEHPVTEAITELDLVDMQFDIANGLALNLSQEQVRFKGHSIEVRLCAEDIATQFTPQSGELLNWAAPKNLRVEHALESGCNITPFYDSMIAKIISFGNTRQEACDQLIQGLTELVAQGIPSNQDFLIACLRHPNFEKGDFNTAFIERNFDSLTKRSPDQSKPLDEIVAAALLFTLQQALPIGGIAHPYPVSLKFWMDGPKRAIILQSKKGLEIRHGEVQATVKLKILGTGLVTVNDGQQSHQITYAARDNTIYFRYNGQNFHAVDQRFAPDAASHTAAQNGICYANTSGKVVAVHVAIGATVEVGQALVTIEAMKMEHVHVSKVRGLVEAMNVEVGDQIRQKQAIVGVKTLAQGVS
jgi:geranyl-CoA carboxylase alpha subunit